jgi:hypothetical protein
MSRSAAALLLVLSIAQLLAGDGPSRRLLEDLGRREPEAAQEG